MVDGLCADSRKVRARSRKKGALLLENIIEQIFEPQFRQISLRPVSGNNQIKGSGITYRPAPDVGEGYYWVQPIRDLCAVTIADLTFKKEVELNYEHPSFLKVKSAIVNAHKSRIGTTFSREHCGQIGRER